MTETITPPPNDKVAERLYEMFNTDEDAPVWSDLPEEQRRIWLLRSSSIMEIALDFPWKP